MYEIKGDRATNYIATLYSHLFNNKKHTMCGGATFTFEREEDFLRKFVTSFF